MIIALLPGSVAAAPVDKWDFILWGSSPEQVWESAITASLQPSSVSIDDASQFGLPDREVPFGVAVKFYKLPARAFLMFKSGKLANVRVVVLDPKNCDRVLAELAGEYGPGEVDQRFPANLNWETARFSLTVPHADFLCWPMFSPPGQ